MIEILLRVIGYEPYQPIVFQMNQIRMEPKPVFIEDSLLGYKMDSGVYKLYYHDNTYWQTTHNNNGYRITSINDTDYSSKVDLPQINILGCSFTHGSGLKDEETYPFLLQKELPKYKVNNYGVGGYGIANAYIQLTRLLDIDTDDIVLYSYIGAHDNRYDISAFKKLYPSKSTLDHINFVSIDSNFNLHYSGYNYTPWPLISYSAFVNLLEDTYISWLESKVDRHKIAKKVLLEMSRFCDEKGVKFVFVGLSDDNETKDMLNYCNQKNIYHVDASVDLDDNQYNLLPYDDHPNAFANQYFKKVLFNYLESENIIVTN